MKTLIQSLLTAVQHLPNACYIRAHILRNDTMSLMQKIIASMFALTEKEEYGFYVAYEPALIEAVIEAAELPMTGESYAEIKSQLFTTSMLTALKGIGVEVTRNERHPDYVTVWGPGVKRG